MLDLDETRDVVVDDDGAGRWYAGAAVAAVGCCLNADAASWQWNWINTAPSSSSFLE